MMYDPRTELADPAFLKSGRIQSQYAGSYTDAARVASRSAKLR